MCLSLRWSLRVFPGCQDSYDLSECHRLYHWGRADSTYIRWHGSLCLPKPYRPSHSLRSYLLKVILTIWENPLRSPLQVLISFNYSFRFPLYFSYTKSNQYQSTRGNLTMQVKLIMTWCGVLNSTLTRILSMRNWECYPCQWPVELTKGRMGSRADQRKDGQ